MRTKLPSLPALVALGIASTSVADEELSKLRTAADSIRATAAEMNYTRIPWVTDLFEGFRLAKDEKRPVFLYVITGDPLADC